MQLWEGEPSPAADVGRSGVLKRMGDTSGNVSCWGMCHGMKLVSDIVAVVYKQPEEESTVHVHTCAQGVLSRGANVGGSGAHVRRACPVPVQMREGMSLVPVQLVHG